MNLETYLMIKRAGEDGIINTALGQLAAMRGSHGAGTISGGTTSAAMAAGAPHEVAVEATNGVLRRHQPSFRPLVGDGPFYNSPQQAVADELTGKYNTDTRSIGLSEGALGKVLHNDKLFEKAYRKAPSLFK